MNNSEIKPTDFHWDWLKWPMLTTCAGSILMTFSSFWLISHKKEFEWTLVVATLISITCAFVSAVALLSGVAILRLERECFSVVFLSRKMPVRWLEVEQFSSGKILGMHVVFYDLIERKASESLADRFFFALFNHHGYLPSTREMPARQLTEHMNLRLQNYRAQRDLTGRDS